MKKKNLFFFTLLLYSFTLSAQTNPFTGTLAPTELLKLSTTATNEAKILQVPHVIILNNITQYPLQNVNFPLELQSNISALRGALVFATNRGISQVDRRNKSLYYHSGTSWIPFPPDHLGNHIMESNTDLNMGTHNIVSNHNLASNVNSRFSGARTILDNIVYTNGTVDPAITYTFQTDENMVIRKGNTVIWAKSWSTTKHSATQNTYMEGYWIIDREGNDRNAIGDKYYIHLNSANNTPGPISIRVHDNNNVGNVFRCEPNGQLRLTNDANNLTHWESTADSDKRMKKNIRPMKKVLDKVLKMELVEFKYKKGMLGYSPDSLHIGVTAQDIMKIFPRYTGDFISYNSHYNRYYVSYRHLSILALEGIKEFKIQHDEKMNLLKTKIELKGEKDRITQLKIKLKEMSQRLTFLIQKIQETQQKLYLSNKKKTNITE